MTYKQLSINKAVVYARLLGFVPFEQTPNAKKHFHWYMLNTDDKFSVSVLDGLLSYTVNRDTTSSLGRACELLKEVESAQNKALEELSHEIDYVSRCYTLNGVHPDPKIARR